MIHDKIKRLNNMSIWMIYQSKYLETAYSIITIKNSSIAK